MADYKKVHKLLGLKTITADEFSSLMKMSASKRKPMLEDVAKKEKGYSDYKALVKALEGAGLT